MLVCLWKMQRLQRPGDPYCHASGIATIRLTGEQVCVVEHMHAHAERNVLRAVCVPLYAQCVPLYAQCVLLCAPCVLL